MNSCGGRLSAFCFSSSNPRSAIQEIRDECRIGKTVRQYSVYALEAKRTVKRRCEICGKAIPRERLEALPDTRRCIECARANGTDFCAKRADVGMDPDTYKDLLGAVRS